MSVLQRKLRNRDIKRLEHDPQIDTQKVDLHLDGVTPQPALQDAVLCGPCIDGL